MISTENRKYKPFYKKFIRLRVDPINNDKILRFKKKKWKTFLIHLKIRNSYYKIYKPFSHYNYSIAKFASQGNSFKRKFRNDLIARQTFNYFYGNLQKKVLKNHVKQIYNSAQFRNYKRLFLELFESRLDSVLYRSKFTNSIKEAKQLIAHKHVKVNNRIEKNRSYILHKGDLVQVDTYASKIIKNNLRKQPTKNVIFTYRDKTTKKTTTKKIKKQIWPVPPKYLIINYNTLEIIFGDLKNVNFSLLFPFKLNVDSIVTNYYRH